MSGATFGCQTVTRGFPQGSVLNSVPFNIFINYLDAGLECISKPAGDIKLRGTVNSLERQEAL